LAQAHRTPHALRMPAKTPLASDADNACCVRDVICNEAVPFRPYCAGVVTRTRNVSEYMPVLAVRLVIIVRMQAKHEALKEEYATFERILRETEDSLQRVNAERAHCASELSEVQRDVAAKHQEKTRLEDEIMEKMRAQLTADKAAKYSAKIVQRLRERTKDLETQVCVCVCVCRKRCYDDAGR